MARAGRVARLVWNRLAAAAVVAVALPHMVLAERLRGGAGQRSAGRWIRVGARLTGLHFERIGEAGGRGPGARPRVLVANHSSPLDIAAVLATTPTARFVAAADLFRVPVLAAAMRAVRAVPVDRRSGTGRLELPDDAVPASLAVFPEGAIAPPGRRLPFRRGAFALAIASGADIVPVAIHRSAQCLPPRAALGIRPGTVVVEYLPTISTAGMVAADRGELCRRAEAAILAALEPSDGGTAGATGSRPAA